MKRWSTHSCRTLLKNRSQMALARGAWYGVLRILMPLVLAIRAKNDPNLLSLSRIRYLGVSPYGVASRSCCATHASVGDLVTPTWMTFRDLSSMTKKAKSGRKNRSVTGKRVACPDLRGVVAQKRAPLLPSWLVGANRPHVLLNGALAHVDAQFQEFTPYAFSTPE